MAFRIEKAIDIKKDKREVFDERYNSFAEVSKECESKSRNDPNYDYYVTESVGAGTSEDWFIRQGYLAGQKTISSDTASAERIK